MKKLRSFRDRDELDQLVEAVTESQKAIRRLVVEAAATMPSAAVALVLCELNSRLFVTNCDKAKAGLPPGERDIVEQDAAELLPRLAELCDDDLVVDLATLERFNVGGNGG